MRERQELLKLTDNSVEIDGFDIGTPSFAFERDCFCWYAQKHPDLLGIGPRLTEEVLNRCNLGYYCKPDGMFFEKREECWTLKKMIEIKSGSLHGMNRKVEGFVRVAHTLRTGNGLMTEAVKTIFDEMDLESPYKITVPPDQNIEVVFVTHKYHQPGEVRAGTSFRLTFLRY